MANVIFPISLMMATGQYFSEYGPEPSEDLVKDQSLKPYLKFTESQSVLVCPRNLQLKKTARLFSVRKPLLCFCYPKRIISGCVDTLYST